MGKKLGKKLALSFENIFVSVYFLPYLFLSIICKFFYDNLYLRFRRLEDLFIERINLIHIFSNMHFLFSLTVSESLSGLRWAEETCYFQQRRMLKWLKNYRSSI